MTSSPDLDSRRAARPDAGSDEQLSTVESRLALGFSGTQAWCEEPAVFDGDGLRISGHPVMQEWEQPYMQRLAELATSNGGRVLEVGYGLGLSCRAILDRPNVDEYEVIECHPDVVARAMSALRTEIGQRRVRVHVGFWQDVTATLSNESFDGILFDTYPLTAEEIHANHLPFFPEAHRLLRPGGVFTYYSDEATTIAPAHLDRLRRAGFTSVSSEIVDVTPPADCQYWQAKTLVAPIVRKDGRRS